MISYNMSVVILVYQIRSADIQRLRRIYIYFALVGPQQEGSHINVLWDGGIYPSVKRSFCAFYFLFKICGIDCSSKYVAKADITPVDPMRFPIYCWSGFIVILRLKPPRSNKMAKSCFKAPFSWGNSFETSGGVAVLFCIWWIRWRDRLRMLNECCYAKIGWIPACLLKSGTLSEAARVSSHPA